MTLDLPTFWTSLGGSAVVLVPAVFIVRMYIKKKIEADVQHKYNGLLEDIKNENAIELAGFKAGYQKVLNENQIRFSAFSPLRLPRGRKLRFLGELPFTFSQELLSGSGNPGRCRGRTACSYHE
jgi:hypothetical protein